MATILDLTVVCRCGQGHDLAWATSSTCILRCIFAGSFLHILVAESRGALHTRVVSIIAPWRYDAGPRTTGYGGAALRLKLGVPACVIGRSSVSRRMFRASATSGPKAIRRAVSLASRGPKQPQEQPHDVHSESTFECGSRGDFNTEAAHQVIHPALYPSGGRNWPPNRPDPQTYPKEDT